MNLLAEALIATDLDGAGTPPYRLHARFKSFDSHGDPTEGEFIFLMAALNRWRGEITWAGGKGIELVAGDRIWRKNVDTRRMDWLLVDRLRHFSRWLSPFPDGKVSSPRRKDLHGISSECIQLKLEFRVPIIIVPASSAFTREVCLESANGMPTRIKDDSIEFEFDRGEYIVLGTRQFPRHIRYSERGRRVFEMDVDSLEGLGNTPEDTFTPPPEAKSLPWCPDEKGPRPLRFYTDQSFRIIFPGLAVPESSIPITEFSLLVFDVGSDGRVKDLKAYDKHGSLLSRSVKAEKLRESVFYPAICGDRIVEGEFILWPLRR